MLGHRIVQLLRDLRRPVRALVRSTATAAQQQVLEATGAQLVVGDLKEPESIAEACRGAAVVVSTATATVSRQDGDSISAVDERGQSSLVETAQRGGVGRFVFLSFPPRRLDYALQRAKRAVEQKLREGVMPYTILQPVNFVEVWLGPRVGFDLLGGKVQIFGAGDQPISWISLHDVARVAVAASEGETFTNRVLPLCGPDPLSPLEVVRMFEEMSGRKVAISHVAEEVLVGRLSVPRDELEETFAAIALSMAQGLVSADPTREILPGRLSTVREYLARLLKNADQQKRGERS
jgi:uncharacterized protein YbjT (DUF2867 family)